jgi:hypothetical protein
MVLVTTNFGVNFSITVCRSYISKFTLEEHE